MISSALKQPPHGLLLLRPRPQPQLPPLPQISIPDRRLSSPLSLACKRPRPTIRCAAAAAGEFGSSLEKVADFCVYHGPLADLPYSIFCSASVGIGYACLLVIAKFILNDFPYPWAVSSVYLAAGTLYMLYHCLSGTFNPVRDTNPHFWKSLFPVALCHTIGLVAQTASLSISSMPFTHIIRCLEPLCSMMLRSVFKSQETQSMMQYLSLLPIVIGVALTEPNLNSKSYIAVMIANFAFAARNILTEKMQDERKAKMPLMGHHYINCLSALSFLILAPFALTMEGPRMWAAGLKTAALQKPRYLVPWTLVALGICCCLYNKGLYPYSFPRFGPFYFFSISTMKKIFAVCCSVAFLNTRLHPVNALGAACAIFGICLYSRELSATSRHRSWLF